MNYNDPNLIPVTYVRGNTLDAGHNDFDLLDAKGRKLGYRWHLRSLTVAPVNRKKDGSIGAYWSQHPSMLGERVHLECSVTRNGQDFGAAHGFARYVFADLETARRKTVELTEAARKRYARKPVEAR